MTFKEVEKIRDEMSPEKLKKLRKHVYDNIVSSFVERKVKAYDEDEVVELGEKEAYKYVTDLNDFSFILMNFKTAEELNKTLSEMVDNN